MRIEKDQWLSGVLQIPSWKVIDLSRATSSSEFRASMLDLAGPDAAFFSTKIPCHDVAAVTSAVRAGCVVVDTNVTFEWAGGIRDAPPEDDNDLKLEAAGPDDVPAIVEIASRSFVYSRFHLDPGFSRAQANDVKRHWARNACLGRASIVYVARRRASAIGFLAVMESKSSSGTVATIDLIGIEPASQGQGAGRALSRMFVDQLRGRADRLRVGTQVSNIPAMRLYESIGFRVSETSYVMHAHVKNGALAI